MKYFQIAIVGHFPLTPSAYGLISEHWENVRESPVPIAQQGDIKDRSYCDRIDRHPILVLEALPGNFSDEDITEDHKSCRHEKRAED